MIRIATSIALAPLALLVAASACSDGQTGATTPATGSKVVTGASGDSGADPDAGSCSGLSSAAQNALVLAYTSASAMLTCGTDSDCILGPAGSDCTAACSGPITTQAGASALQAAIDRVNATTCVTYKNDGCPRPETLPCASGPAGIACVQGTCANFPPAAWTSFAFDQQPGANGFSAPPMCAPGATCSLWTVTPDAHVAVIDPQGSHEATLSASDFATVDGVMRSMTFRQGEMGGFATFMCDSTSGGQVISFDVSRGAGLQGQDVTGCVLAGPTGNGLQTIFDVVKAY